jgi:purine nucleosidase
VTRVVLDTDLGMGHPGSDIDDGFALALALADPGLRVELVTTVNGNTDVDTATRLTVDLLARLGRGDVPVARGCAAPLVRASRSRADARGTVGRGQGDPPSGAASHAAVQIAERVLAEPGELTVVAIGPLTNLALALSLDPRVATAVAGIVVMGGVYLEQTNVAGMPGEFNFWVDPDAASVVLGSGAPLRLVGLDVTRKVRLTREHTAALAATGGAFGRYAADCADQWIDHLAQTMPGDERGRDSCALHDPLALATVTRPDLVEWHAAHVTVETGSDRSRGVAVADLLTTSEPPTPNAQIAVGVDSAGFLDLFLERMRSLG